MYSLSSQNPIRTAPFRVVPQRLRPYRQARLLKGSFEQSGMELADDGSGCDTGLSKDAVLGEDLVAFRDSEGKVGVLQALSPHRQAPLVYGRNEPALIHHHQQVELALTSGLPARPVS